MKRAFLERCLAEGLSLDAMAERVGKHPSTVSYWLKKYGLSALGRSQHAPKGQIEESRLRELVDAGCSIRKLAAEFDAGYSTIRYWLDRFGLETDQMVRNREAEQARAEGLNKIRLDCAKHGRTVFFARPEGGYRCAKCNSAAVSERRRQLKRRMVEEAGGMCAICGFAEHPAALQFHHLDSSRKKFHLAQYVYSRGIARVRAEVQKCVLLCANCHARVEAGALEVPAEAR